MIQNKSFLMCFKAYCVQFSDYSLEQLVTALNEVVRLYNEELDEQAYLAALRVEFYNRGVDFRPLGTSYCVPVKHVVYLKNKKLYRLEDLSPAEVTMIFDNYLWYKHPDLLILNPTIIEYDNEIIRFKVFGVDGVQEFISDVLVKCLLE